MRVITPQNAHFQVGHGPQSHNGGHADTNGDDGVRGGAIGVGGGG